MKQRSEVITGQDALFQALPSLTEQDQPLFATTVNAGRILHPLHQSGQGQISAAGIFKCALVIKDGEDGLKEIRQSRQRLCDNAGCRMAAPDSLAVADLFFSFGKKSCSSLFDGLL